MSYAVKPVNIRTPITEIANCSALDAKNMLTTMAIIMPNSPIKRNEPQEARDFLVV